MARKRGQKSNAAPAVEDSSPARSWTAWFTPDLSLTAALAAVVYCLFVFNAPRQMFNDSDSGWHIIVGEQILRTGQIPHSDSFSFLNVGRPWYAWEWAAETITAVFHQWRGLSGVVFLFTLTIGTVIWMCFRLHRRLGGDFFLACIMAAPFVATAQIHWLARPHVFSYLFLLGAVFYFERGAVRFRVWDGIVIALGTALWAGIHGSFPMAIAIAMLYGAGHAARAILWRELDRERDWSKARWFLLAAACAAAGSLLNPYGLELHKHVYSFSTMTEMTSRIEEWMPFNFQRRDGGQIALVAALGGIGAVLALRRRDVPHFLVMAFLVALGLKSARGLPLIALVALPMANAAITQALSGSMGRLMTVSAGLRKLDLGNHGAALAPVAVFLVFSWLMRPDVVQRTGYPHEWFPVEADAVIAAMPPSSRIFSSSLVGGYLIYRFRGQRKTWIDGRADYFGVQPYKEYELIAKGRPSWEKIVELNGFTHAVVEREAPCVKPMSAAGWRELHRDDHFVVLERPSTVTP